MNVLSRNLFAGFFVCFIICMVWSAQDPSQTYCEGLGFEYSVKKMPEGEVGLCTFPDGSSVSAWDFLRGDDGQKYNYCRSRDYKFKVVKDNCPGDYFGSCVLCILPNGDEVEALELMERDGSTSSKGSETQDNGSTVGGYGDLVPIFILGLISLFILFFIGMSILYYLKIRNENKLIENEIGLINEKYDALNKGGSNKMSRVRGESKNKKGTDPEAGILNEKLGEIEGLKKELEDEIVKIEKERKSLDSEKMALQKQREALGAGLSGIKEVEKKVGDYQNKVEKDKIVVEKDLGIVERDTKIVEVDASTVEKKLSVIDDDVARVHEDREKIESQRKKIENDRVEIEKERKKIEAERRKIYQQEKKIEAERRRIDQDRLEVDKDLREIESLWRDVEKAIKSKGIEKE